MTKEQKLEKIDDAIARWISRGYRAQNAINKLTKQRKRLVKAPVTPVAKPRVKTDSAIPLPELDAFFLPTKPLPLKHHDDLAAMPSNQQDDLTIPPMLKRTMEDRTRDQLAARTETEADPVVKKVNLARLKRMDEKRRGRSMFGKSDMPLTGKDALKAIRAKKT